MQDNSHTYIMLPDIHFRWYTHQLPNGRAIGWERDSVTHFMTS